MGEDELAAIEAHAANYDDLAHYGGRSDEAEEMLCAIERDWATAVPALVAEVRRLRAIEEEAASCYHWRRNDCTPANDADE